MFLLVGTFCIMPSAINMVYLAFSFTDNLRKYHQIYNVKFGYIVGCQCSINPYILGEIIICKTFDWIKDFYSDLLLQCMGGYFINPKRKLKYRVQ